MTRRDLVRGLASIPILRAVDALEAERRLNVVFMVADDMNTALGCYGHPVVKTPNLDRLAARGVRFDRAYAQFPLCAPSRASFLSGRRPEATKVLSLTTPSRKYMQDVVMLPEFFRKNRYYTFDCGKIYHTGEEHEDPRSWDFELKESGKKPSKAEVLEENVAPKPRNHSMEWQKLRTPDEATPDGIVARTAVQHIRKAVGNGQPFFAAVGFRRPHAPYAVPTKYFDLYDSAKIRLPDPGRRTFPAAAQYELENQPPLSDKDQREYRAAYFACNSFVDAQAGYVFKALDEMKLWDSTIVVFFGDHGYLTGEHGMWHKMTLFEDCVRVPLIIHVPGAPGSGKVCRSLVELVDLYPTLVQECGMTPPKGLEGVSLKPLLDNPSRQGKSAVFAEVGRNADRNLSHKQPTFFGKSVRTEQWRYIEWDGGKLGIELYDEKTDPGEISNLAADHKYSSVVQQMSKLLHDGPPAVSADTAKRHQPVLDL